MSSPTRKSSSQIYIRSIFDPYISVFLLYRAQSLLEIYREAKEEEENALTESEMEGAEPYIPKCEICPSPTHYCEKCQADKCTCPDERLLGNRTQEVGAVGEKKQDKEVASSDKQEMNEKQEVTAASKQEVGVESAVEDKVEVVKQEEDFVQEDVAEKKIKMAEQEVEGGEYVKQEEEEGASLKQEEEVGASLKQEEEAGTIGEEEKREIREQMQALMDKVTQLRQETKRKHELNRQLIKRIEEQELEQIAEVSPPTRESRSLVCSPFLDVQLHYLNSTKANLVEAH